MAGQQAQGSPLAICLLLGRQPDQDRKQGQQGQSADHDHGRPDVLGRDGDQSHEREHARQHERGQIAREIGFGCAHSTGREQPNRAHFWSGCLGEGVGHEQVPKMHADLPSGPDGAPICQSIGSSPDPGRCDQRPQRLMPSVPARI